MTPKRTDGGAQPGTPSGAADDPGPTSPLVEVVEGYVDLAGWLTREIGAHARTVATRLEAGDYTPDLVARDAARSAALVAATSFRIVNEAFDAVVLVARPPKPRIVELEARLPEPFGVPCTLELDGPLQTGFESPHLIREDRVTFHPAKLRANQVRFTVRVDASRRPGLIYEGRVRATPEDPAVEPRFVDLVVVVR